MKKQTLSSIDNHPLQWPESWPRNKHPKRSSFHTKKSRWETRNKTVSEAINFLTGELRLFGVDTDNSVVISTNIRTRNDGLPYSNAKEPEDSGVAVYFKKDGEPACMPCDTYDRVADNIYAVGKVIEALRAIERHGSDIMNAAFTGFKALPETGSGSKWWDILELPRSAPMDVIKKAYRIKSKQYHPDAGGTTEDFQAVQIAFQQAKTARQS